MTILALPYGIAILRRFGIRICIARCKVLMAPDFPWTWCIGVLTRAAVKHESKQAKFDFKVMEREGRRLSWPAIRRSGVMQRAQVVPIDTIIRHRKHFYCYL